MQRFACPNCNKSLKFADEFAGREVKCPKCGDRVCLPGANGGPDHASAPDGAQIEHLKSEIAWLLMEAAPVAWAHPMLRSMFTEASDPGIRFGEALIATSSVIAEIDATPAPMRLQKARLLRDTIRDAVREAQSKNARALRIDRLLVYMVPALFVALIVVMILGLQGILPRSVGQAAAIVLGILFWVVILWSIVRFARWVSQKLRGG